MHKPLILALVVLSACSPAEKCQEFNSGDPSISATNKLGLGYQASVLIGFGVGPLEVTGTLPTGMALETTDGQIRVSGTPTTEGRYQADVRPTAAACEFKGSSLVNLVVDLTVVPAECDNALACRLLKTSGCTQSSTCTPSFAYTSAACIHSLGDAGVCVDVNGPADQCSGSVSAMTLTTVEGAQVESCVGTPPIVGCNYHLCYGAPDAG